MGESPTIAREASQAVLTIDLGALAANWRLLRDKVAPAECAAVVKADGYGVGLEPAGREDDGLGAQPALLAVLGQVADARHPASVGEEAGDAVTVAQVDTVFAGHARVVGDEPLPSADVADVEAAPEQVAPVRALVRLAFVHEPVPQPETGEPAQGRSALGDQDLREGRIVATAGHALHVAEKRGLRIRRHGRPREPVVRLDEGEEVVETVVGDPRGAGGVVAVPSRLVLCGTLEEDDPPSALAGGVRGAEAGVAAPHHDDVRRLGRGGPRGGRID